jgi:DNA-binding NarL/FixJ family response regulator
MRGELRIAIVDDHRMFRDAFRALLRLQPEVELVAEAGSAHQALETIPETHPDIVLVDVGLPDRSGFELAAELTRAPLTPRPKVVFLTALADERSVARAFAAGARGFVSKEQPADAVLDAIRQVARGVEYVPPTISRFAVDARRAELEASGPAGGSDTAAEIETSHRRETNPHALGPLTEREQEIFGLLVGGVRNDDIAERLHISVKTVETHRTRVLRKLGAHSLADLIRYAIRHGLI